MGLARATVASRCEGSEERSGMNSLSMSSSMSWRRSPGRLWNTACCMIAVIIVASLVVAYASGQARAFGQGRPVAAHYGVQDDVKWLASFMRAITDNEMSLTASNFGKLTDERDVEEIAGEFMAAVHGAKYTKKTADGLAVEVRPNQDTTISLGIRTIEPGQVYMVASIHSPGVEEDLNIYAAWLNAIEQLWASVGLATDWRINVQSTLHEGQEPQLVWDLLGQSGAEKLSTNGSYSDRRTSSETFYVPQLRSWAMIGDQKGNLQAALHRSTESETYRITLGTPLITIEY